MGAGHLSQEDADLQVRMNLLGEVLARVDKAAKEAYNLNHALAQEISAGSVQTGKRPSPNRRAGSAGGRRGAGTAPGSRSEQGGDGETIIAGSLS